MIKRVVVLASKIEDVYQLARLLRDADVEEVCAMGADPKKALRANFRGAFLRQTAFVDGKIAAMWGLYATNALSDIGYPYLLTSSEVERVPVSTLREGQKAISRFLQIKPQLEGYVLASYKQACRFLEALGFALDAPAPLGPNNIPFRRFSLIRR